MSFFLTHFDFFSFKFFLIHIYVKNYDFSLFNSFRDWFRWLRIMSFFRTLVFGHLTSNSSFIFHCFFYHFVQSLNFLMSDCLVDLVLGYFGFELTSFIFWFSIQFKLGFNIVKSPLIFRHFFFCVIVSRMGSWGIRGSIWLGWSLVLVYK